MSELWVEKYRPENFDEFRGSSKKIKEVKDWLENWDSGKKKALLLTGKPGIGKTTLAHILADKNDLELVETNASDVRTKNALKENLEQAVKQRSFFGKGKLILIDEIDGMSRSDRGGRKIIKEIIKESRFPVILTANDAYANGMRAIRNLSKTVKLGKVHTNSIAAHLKRICSEEGIEYDKTAIKSLASKASGDMRAAINDLESLAHKYDEITTEVVKQLGYRETERDIFEALKILFKTTTAKTASNSSQNLDVDYNEFMEWIRENIPKEYKKEKDVSRAYDNLSQADVFKGRIIRRQNWGLLKYVYDLMTVGVALSKEEKYKGFTRYSYPSKIKKMGKSKAMRSKRDRIAKKISKKLHISMDDALGTFMFLKKFLDREDWKESIVKEIDLTEKEVEYIESFE